MKPKVFVVQPIPEVAIDVLREAFDVTVYPYMDRQITIAELIAYTRDADWLFVMHETSVTAEVLRVNPNLKGVGCIASISPHVDLAVANELKIPVVIADLATSPTVWKTTADLTMAMILGLAYRLVESDQYTRCGKFRQEQTMALMGIGCPGKTVGIIGMGRVAEIMPPRCRAFDMNVLYTKRTRLTKEREKELGIEWIPTLHELIPRSDFVVVLCDYSKDTHKLFGKREFALMKKDAYFVNTGRGRIVDEPELIKALQEKRIAGAALDVYWNEPYLDEDGVPEAPSPEPWVPEALCKLDNVILAPHNGGATWDVRGGKAAKVAEQMVLLSRGGRATVYNPEIYR